MLFPNPFPNTTPNTDRPTHGYIVPCILYGVSMMCYMIHRAQDMTTITVHTYCTGLCVMKKSARHHSFS